MKCKNCGEELTQDMIDVNLCWFCGDIIDENFSDQSAEATKPVTSNSDSIKANSSKDDDNSLNDKNIVGTVLKILGVIILIFGTIGSFILADSDERYYSFSFVLFISYEFAALLSGFLLIGFAEIIQLLASINSKLK